MNSRLPNSLSPIHKVAVIVLVSGPMMLVPLLLSTQLPDPTELHIPPRASDDPCGHGGFSQRPDMGAFGDMKVEAAEKCRRPIKY